METLSQILWALAGLCFVCNGQGYLTVYHQTHLHEYDKTCEPCPRCSLVRELIRQFESELSSASEESSAEV